MAEIGGRLRNAEAFQIGWRRTDDHLHIRELARDQLRIRQMPDAKRKMDILLDHVDGAVEQQQIDGDLRMATQEFGEQRRNQQAADQGWRTDAKAPGRLLAPGR